MYGFTLKVLDAMRVLGLKKTAVRAAFFLSSVKNGDIADAASTYLYLSRSGFDQCAVCGFPVVSETDKAHQDCREYTQLINDESEKAWLEYDAEMQRELALDHLDILLDSFCTNPNCYNEGEESDGKCNQHTEAYDYPEDEGSCDPENDKCQGECGQTVRTCSCAEYASLRRHNADPATRGSWWIA